MQAIPADIWISIASELPSKDAASLFATCRRLRSMESESFWRKMAQRSSVPVGKDAPKEAALFGPELRRGWKGLQLSVADEIGSVTYHRLPELELRWVRDYLDWLSADDLSAPLMRGMDNCRRAFLAMRYRDESTGEMKAIMVHERYTDMERPVVNGTRYLDSCFDDRLMTSDQFKRMADMLLGTCQAYTLC